MAEDNSEASIIEENMDEENIKNKANSHLFDMMKKMSFSEMISATNPQNITKKDEEINENFEEKSWD